jgi:hypothetical protein
MVNLLRKLFPLPDLRHCPDCKHEIARHEKTFLKRCDVQEQKQWLSKAGVTRRGQKEYCYCPNTREALREYYNGINNDWLKKND